jgi:hypothetical protein
MVASSIVIVAPSMGAGAEPDVGSPAAPAPAAPVCVAVGSVVAGGIEPLAGDATEVPAGAGGAGTSKVATPLDMVPSDPDSPHPAASPCKKATPHRLANVP